MAEKKAPLSPKYEACEHRKATSPMRPDAGTQAAFKKRKPPATYLYDSSLPLTLASDDQACARQGRTFPGLRPISLNLHGSSILFV